MTAMAPDAVTGEFLRSHIVWDNHACMPIRPADDSFLPQLARARAAGFTVVSINVGFGESTLEQQMLMLAQVRGWVKRHPEDYLLVASADDVQRAHREGKLGVCFDIEGASAVAEQHGLVQLYYDLGVRWMLLAYNRNNAHGGGCHDDDAGLTPRGSRLLREMADSGIVACASHAGPLTARAIIDASPNPVIFSHSNARALHDHPRNVGDDVIRACAARGGVVCINGISLFLGTQTGLADAVARHADHVAQLVGPAHVGFGLDYIYDQQELTEYLEKMRHTFPADGGYSADMTMLAPEGFADVVTALRQRGWSDAALAQACGGNLQRIAGQVWK